MRKVLTTALLSLASFTAVLAQRGSNLPQKAWVDSVFKSLTPQQKIAQLMVIRAHSNLGSDHIAGVEGLIRKYNVGALCFFQGGPVRQANLTNRYQALAQTPLLVTIDGEWGLGMRLDSVTRFPYQATLGALTDTALVYEMGGAVGRQMKRIGVHVNYAPTVDVNNNPNNPVIGFRSFGENKEQVARMGIAYMRGMQGAGIMATAKHFPGHGDTEVDSHYDLPVINKSRAQLDSLELYPFRELLKAGVGSVMVGHLFIPSIDNRPNRPTSLSHNAVTKILRDELGFKGLIFTDGMEMKGLTKFFPAGAAAVESLLAGNDMLCLPEDVPAAISAVETAVKKKKLKWKDIDERVRRVLEAKYQLGLAQPQVVETTNLLADLNKETARINDLVARNAFTVLRNEDNAFPIARMGNKKLAYVGIGAVAPTVFGDRLKTDLGVDAYYFPAKGSTAGADSLMAQLDTTKYAAIIVGVHNYSLRPSGNFGLSAASLQLWNRLSKDTTTATVLFGNVYAAKNFCTARNLAAAYQDDSITHEAIADFMIGKYATKGRLPVTVCGFKPGSGLSVSNLFAVGFAPQWLAIDSIARWGLERRAYPGAQVIALHKGRIVYHKTFGRLEFDESSQTVTFDHIYDLASVTKTSATTVAVMKLYEEGKIDIDKTLGDYLPITRGTDKQGLTLRNILLHQAGLNPFISFYKETIDPATGKPSDSLYRTAIEPNFTIPVARNLYLRNDWNDTMMLRIMQSKLGPQDKYVYSDNDFILLGKIVEAVSGQRLDQYTYNTFYKPMGMTTTSFRAGERYGVERVVPTENEKWFRRQMLRGTVHDEGASLFGGISGHAGLFSNAYDLSVLYQMLLQGGEWNGKRYLKPETIAYFTDYHSAISRRGLGFDKPEKDNATRPDPYPARYVSPKTYGHTGFTGTCVWVDPEKELVYIFLSNRVYNTRDNNLLSELRIRGRIQEAIYKAIEYGETKKALQETPIPAPGAQVNTNFP
ncbi:beta-glucosidase [Cnuella takakiae]|uniref:beta-N-acetylhexosaminidase n=1 Tax=Cnuella takakiae TaxID=1302690 RepID=A0A1M5D2T0_9BACT|nr:glycoside hydrolase family 3 N-terminal domain-containing protein [Cnuella takakiae]OLY94126.1 serine hydrolase [Cnuella takakiae]SHF61254.1 beta-glucosidase [Cnuella takakiae]